MKKLFLIIVFLLYGFLANGQSRFDHILITNDDGIEDSDRLIALAKSVKDVADRVSIIVSVFD